MSSKSPDLLRIHVVKMTGFMVRGTMQLTTDCPAKARPETRLE